MRENGKRGRKENEIEQRGKGSETENEMGISKSPTWRY
jgi:hypothetical protein